MGVGSTGGGPDIPGHPEVPALDWDALARDLRLARRWCDDLLIHSLEGCVRQGFLPRLRSFDWEPAVAPPGTTWRAAGLRRSLRCAAVGQRLLSASPGTESCPRSGVVRLQPPARTTPTVLTAHGRHAHPLRRYMLPC